MFKKIFLFLKLLTIYVICNVDAKSISQPIKASFINETVERASTDDYDYKVYQLKFAARGLPPVDSMGAPPSPFMEIHGDSKYETTQVLYNTFTPEWPDVFSVLHTVGQREHIVTKVFHYDIRTGHKLIGTVYIPLPIQGYVFSFNIPGTTAELIGNVVNFDDDDNGGGVVWWKIVIYVVAGLIALVMLVVCCKVGLLSELIGQLVESTCDSG